MPTLLEPLQLNLFDLSVAFLASLAGAALLTYRSAPSLTSIRSKKDRRLQQFGLLSGSIGFSLSHILVLSSTNVPFVRTYYFLHVLFTILGCYAAAKFGLRYAGQPRSGFRQYFRTSLIITFIILSFDYANILLLFGTHLAWRLELVLLSIAIVLILCFAVIKLLAVSNRNREHSLHTWTRLPGVVLAGAALFGTPLLCILSVIPSNDIGTKPVFLVPYVFMLFITSALYMIPDAFLEDRQRRQNQRIIETEQHYMSLYEYNPDSVLAFDPSGRITGMNRQAELLEQRLGLQLSGIRFYDLLQEEQKQPASQHFNHVLSGKSSSIELQVKAADSSILHLWLTSLPIMIDHRLVGAYSIIKDMTSHKKDQELIRHLAYHDELTGLANRRSFKHLLTTKTAKIAMDTHKSVPFSVLFIDLDRFKRINDLFGHDFGDRVIKQAAQKLQHCLPASCTIARIGGDEFTVLIPDVKDRAALEILAGCVVHEFAQPFEVGNHSVKLSASVGIATFPEDGLDADALMKHSDAAMYNAKENGSSQYQFYDAERDQTSIEQIILENDLELAIQADQMRLVYQPKVDIRTGEVIGLEALVRWQHPLLGVISPGQFIPVAEKSGLIVGLEKWVLRTACTQVKKWLTEGRQVRPVAVNISQIHLMKPDIFDSIMELLTELALDPELLELEITESAMMHNEEHVIRILNDLRKAGISVSMDDFGTGYSSLSYLHSLPIGCLKIDRSFVSNITSDSDSRAIAEMIISMARQIGLAIVAEGVETEAQVALLKELQCYNAQGFYYSKPLTPDEVSVHLPVIFEDEVS
ncbi:EAL domain-containing protein [Paenibacillus zeisoli]|uniref:EAL domain-containing protein n=1 Tax=Paenibacillus zeisoli TaxID=2496267 RepID=A0A433X919_9BACL|nr:EAL domain-containing protein [Paenibacillus zeisoli]RUT30552.1 EAL domain-containing protein [Paenibacillus zeisoli]